MFAKLLKDHSFDLFLVTKKVKANFPQNSLSDNKAADEVCVFDEQSLSYGLTAVGWMKKEMGTTKKV